MTDIVWPSKNGWFLGVTGTRFRRDGDQAYPTARQIEALHRLIDSAVAHGARKLRHGACTGWDEEAARYCSSEHPEVLIFAHPPVSTTHLSIPSLEVSHFILKAKPYNLRNIDIANHSEAIAAGTNWPEHDPRNAHSGTWMTIRFSRSAGAIVYACDPEGNIRNVTEAACQHPT